MDLENIWNAFLEKMKIKFKPILFETWFKETKLINLDDNKATILVPLDVHKTHLKENYLEMIKETFMEVTGSIFDFDFVTSNDLDKENIKIKENDDAIFESGLDSKYTFDNFVCGESNKFAKTIGMAVAEKPGNSYNPLLFHALNQLSSHVNEVNYIY